MYIYIYTAVPRRARARAGWRMRIERGRRVRPEQVQLPPNEGLALVAYTHDVNNADGSKEGNVYFECNRMLRLRSIEQRAAMMRTWGAYVHYLLRALGRLPNVVGDVFRGHVPPSAPP